jgi:hypothetical protein
MSTFTIQINENSEAGKTFKQLIEFFKNQSGVKVIEKESEIESPYDPEFVKMIEKAEKRGNYTEINPNDIWGSIK